jgi:CubicO group peptidase (beta-lactamase class C family)
MRNSSSKPVPMPVAAAATGSIEPAMDGVVERALQLFDVPGIALAIVKDGRIVAAKGYGVRKLGEAAPVTPRTIFRIASNTKAFTAAALAILVDEGKLHWDDRVIDRMPGFQMYDPYVTRELTVRDLLTHRSGLGLGAGDLLFWPATDLTRDEIIRRIRFLKPATSFRSAYAYDNLLYLVAGQIIPLIDGRSWDDFVKERIFTPLGMSRTSVSTRELETSDDLAAPHARSGGSLVPLAHTDHDNNAPAGAINASVEDMAKWVLLQLDRGRIANGGTLFSEARSREMWSAQTILPIEDPPQGAPAPLAAAQPQFRAYGLGWMLQDFRGHKIVYHTGTLIGLVSRVVMMPDQQLGVVVLTNQEQRGAHAAIAWSVLDCYLGVPPVDWVGVFHEMAKIENSEGDAAVRTAAARRNPGTRPALALAAYAGRYRDAWYGDVAIEERGGKLTISFTHTPQLTGDLEHWQYDTFVARWHDRTLNADAYVIFSMRADGTIGEAKMEPVSPRTDFSFDFRDLDLRRVVGI